MRIRIDSLRLSHLSITLQQRLIKHLTTWYCSQFVYHRIYDYTMGMSLMRASRAFLSHSEDMLVLSTEINSSSDQFARVPVLVRRYGRLTSQG